jgi:hypothetical protein
VVNKPIAIENRAALLSIISATDTDLGGIVNGVACCSQEQLEFTSDDAIAIKKLPAIENQQVPLLGITSAAGSSNSSIANIACSQEDLKSSLVATVPQGTLVAIQNVSQLFTLPFLAGDELNSLVFEIQDMHEKMLALYAIDPIAEPNIMENFHIHGLRDIHCQIINWREEMDKTFVNLNRIPTMTAYLSTNIVQQECLTSTPVLQLQN